MAARLLIIDEFQEFFVRGRTTDRGRRAVSLFDRTCARAAPPGIPRVLGSQKRWARALIRLARRGTLGQMVNSAWLCRWQTKPDAYLIMDDNNSPAPALAGLARAILQKRRARAGARWGGQTAPVLGGVRVGLCHPPRGWTAESAMCGSTNSLRSRAAGHYLFPVPRFRGNAAGLRLSENESFASRSDRYQATRPRDPSLLRLRANSDQGGPTEGDFQSAERQNHCQSSASAMKQRSSCSPMSMGSPSPRHSPWAAAKFVLIQSSTTWVRAIAELLGTGWWAGRAASRHSEPRGPEDPSDHERPPPPHT